MKKKSVKKRTFKTVKPSDLRDKHLRDHILYLLKGGGAHVSFDDAIGDWPVQLAGVKVANFPHTAWMLLEHMRLAQWDILDFSRNSAYQELKFPDDYWPATEAPPSAAAWDQSIEQFRRDLKAMERLISDPNADLTARIPHGQGQTLLREALILADHNSYHLGQLVFVRKILEAK